MSAAPLSGTDPVGIADEPGRSGKRTEHRFGHGALDQHDPRLQGFQHGGESGPEIFPVFAAPDAAVSADGDNAVLRNAKKDEFFRQEIRFVTAFIRSAKFLSFS